MLRICYKGSHPGRILRPGALHISSLYGVVVKLDWRNYSLSVGDVVPLRPRNAPFRAFRGASAGRNCPLTHG